MQHPSIQNPLFEPLIKCIVEEGSWEQMIGYDWGMDRHGDQSMMFPKLGSV